MPLGGGEHQDQRAGLEERFVERCRGGGEAFARLPAAAEQRPLRSQAQELVLPVVGAQPGGGEDGGRVEREGEVAGQLRVGGC